MKKIVLLSIICVALANSAFSQFKIGVRGGVNFNNVKMVQSENEPIQISYEQGMGFHVGLTSQLQISKLFFQPELLFSTVSNDVTLDDIRTGGSKEITSQRFNRFDIPLVAGIKVGSFKIGAGPVATKMLNSRSELLDKYEMQNNRSTIGYQLVAGFDFDNFNIEMRYEGNLSNIGSGVKVGNTIYDFDQRISQVIITSAIYF